MIGFNYTQQSLKAMTFGTCIFGGIFWTSKYFENKRKLVENSKHYNHNTQYQISLLDTFSVKAVMAVFYSYLAININNALINTALCDVDTLVKGYVVVTGALVVDVAIDVYEYLKISKV
jgi:hypothetical protein